MTNNLTNPYPWGTPLQRKVMILAALDIVFGLIACGVGGLMMWFAWGFWGSSDMQVFRYTVSIHTVFGTLLDISLLILNIVLVLAASSRREGKIKTWLFCALIVWAFRLIERSAELSTTVQNNYNGFNSLIFFVGIIVSIYRAWMMVTVFKFLQEMAQTQTGQGKETKAVNNADIPLHQICKTGEMLLDEEENVPFENLNLMHP